MHMELEAENRLMAGLLAPPTEAVSRSVLVLRTVAEIVQRKRRHVGLTRK